MTSSVKISLGWDHTYLFSIYTRFSRKTLTGKQKVNIFSPLFSVLSFILNGLRTSSKSTYSSNLNHLYEVLKGIKEVFFFLKRKQTYW